jgi:hypothetical protein
MQLAWSSQHSYGRPALADNKDVKPLTRPLFFLDAGWLFIMAGIAVCAAGVLLPAQSDLEALRRQLHQLQSEETRAYARLKAHADFMDQVDRADPSLVRRLAAAQLNMLPEGDTPVLLAGSTSSPVTSWIENTIELDIRAPKPKPVSTLGRWANGPNRLWFFGGGIMAVFVGLILSPAPIRSKQFAPIESEFIAGESSSMGNNADVLGSQDRLAFEVNEDSDVATAVGHAALQISEAGTDELIVPAIAQSPIDIQADPCDIGEESIDQQDRLTACSIVEVQPPALDLSELRGELVADSTGAHAIQSTDEHIDDLITMIEDSDTYQTPEEFVEASLEDSNLAGSEIGVRPSLRVIREAAD